MTLRLNYTHFECATVCEPLRAQKRAPARLATRGSAALFAAFQRLDETSHAFREADDPSQYDNMKAFFKASNPPLSNKVGGAKQTIRLYTFILPFWGSFFFAYCAFLASAWCESSQAKPKTGRRVALTLDATAVRRSALLKLAQRLSAILSKQVPHHRYF